MIKSSLLSICRVTQRSGRFSWERFVFLNEISTALWFILIFDIKFSCNQIKRRLFFSSFMSVSATHMAAILKFQGHYHSPSIGGYTPRYPCCKTLMYLDYFGRILTKRRKKLNLLFKKKVIWYLEVLGIMTDTGVGKK